MKHNIFHTLLLFSCITVMSAQELPDFLLKADSFLETYVTDGRVKYAAIKERPDALNLLLASAQNISVATSDAVNYQAFWINAYNLLVIQGIVRNFPLKSPLDVAGFFDKIIYEIGGEQITLNAIENKLLRANFPTEARFHFVLVCAGLGCPPIINSAYKPATLDAQLQEQTVKALNDPNFIKVEKDKVGISQLFDWYAEDFVRDGTVVDFINTYRTEKLPENVKVSYYPYDWNLNGVK